MSGMEDNADITDMHNRNETVSKAATLLGLRLTPTQRNILVGLWNEGRQEGCIEGYADGYDDGSLNARMAFEVD